MMSELFRTYGARFSIAVSGSGALPSLYAPEFVL